ncbi:type IV pilus secretin PilQ family protein [Alishewanella sp. 16-MA]|uniref:Type IV pilus secretin PilQ family protein n=1 Tax=Alishewanella maricola TaxID=2795740 RepID=A0ABS8C4U4_9ALTE|nr:MULTISPECIES: type IV pilus secretin PilQ family protein [Alishewanella]MCB5227000.1 type IV pilus secretin PilQ family protein [Alishewanella maricola]MDP4944579.1 type IV pilus secretin PilQ family protein [Alishewanella sp.]MDP5186243.1 type IV pilus secretin PilQ family protein [Alishewanella sp.]MDP5459517.1 type IV pilus secretin PilQ family protein [Alishewanella sp. SMS8]
MDKLIKIKNVGRKVSRLGLLSWLLLALPASAAPLLYEVRFNPLLNGETEIEFVFDEPLLQEPDISLLNEPSRLNVRFAEAELEQRIADVAINNAGVSRVKSTLSEGGINSVISMDSLKVYRTRLDGNVYAVHLANSPQIVKAGSTSELNPSFINKLQAIDFRRGDKGEGRILVFLKENAAAVDVQERLGKLEIEFYNTDIPDELLYQLDVGDFATVVKGIETFKTKTSTRLVIDATDQFTFNYQQIDNIFTVTMQRDLTSRSILGGGRDYKGRAISLNFQDIPVRTVLQIIADYNGFNLVTSDSVVGNITLRLDGTPWDQALDIVMRVKGLDKRMEGNILLVAPTEELAAREAKELEVLQRVEELEPLYSDFLQINYAKAVDLALLLSNKDATLLSPRGSVVVDERTNTILIKDTARNIENVRRLIERLDIPVRQVLIESRIVTVNDSVTDELGIRWGFSDQQSTSGGDRGVSGNATGANGISTGGFPALDDRWNVNLPVSSPAGSIAFHVARLADGTLLDLELSALEQENKGEVIASPRITTSNQKEASIEQGVEIPYVQAASSGATTVEFKKAVLSLTVTPQITPDNKIILDLVITQNTRGETVQTPTGPATAIDTQQIKTQVLADNGETIVLGGIYQQQVVSTVTKVPLLGDLPYMGVLFRNKSELNEKSELLIFVTPRILTEGQP